MPTKAIARDGIDLQKTLPYLVGVSPREEFWGMHAKRVCEGCGKSFRPQRSWGRFCSAACNMRAWRRAQNEGIARIRRENAELKLKVRELEGGGS